MSGDRQTSFDESQAPDKFPLRIALICTFATIDLVMQSPLQRLYKTKFALLSVVATVAGYALMRAGSWVATQPGLHLLKDADLFDIGVAVMTSGLVGIAFQFVGAADAEQEAKRQFREVIGEEAPAIQQAVVNAMALAPHSVLDVTAPEVLDQVVENSLAKQLGDKGFAADIYRDLKSQVLRSPERWRDLRISIDLAPWRSMTAASDVPPMFVATFRYDYRVSSPANVMRFASVSDLGEYRELQADPGMTEVWYVQPKAGVRGSSPEAFELVEVAVDGRRQKIRRTTRADAQFYSVRLEENGAHGNEATVSFTYRGLLQQHGHLLYVDLFKPTKRLTVNLAYGGTGIRYVSVADYIAAAEQPIISRLPASDPSPSVSLTFDGWVMPKSGVAFVWVLEDEVAGKLPTGKGPSFPAGSALSDD